MIAPPIKIFIKQEKHQKRKKVLQDIQNHYRDANALLGWIGEILVTDDVMWSNLASIILSYRQKIDNLSTFAGRGRLIEKFPGNDLKNLDPI